MFWESQTQSAVLGVLHLFQIAQTSYACINVTQLFCKHEKSLLWSFEFQIVLFCLIICRWNQIHDFVRFWSDSHLLISTFSTFVQRIVQKNQKAQNIDLTLKIVMPYGVRDEIRASNSVWAPRYTHSKKVPKNKVFFWNFRRGWATLL